MTSKINHEIILSNGAGSVGLHQDAYPGYGLPGDQKWIESGQVKYHETITGGFKNTPKAFIEMLQGKNFGKAIVRI